MKTNGATIREGERIDDLGRNNYKVIQNPSMFTFGMDAVLLSAYARAKAGDKVLDLCCGNAVIPILMSARYGAASYTGIEILEEAADMARRSVALNGLKIPIITGDIKDESLPLPVGFFDVVTANPPYIPLSAGRLNETPQKAAARHELFCNIQDVARAASRCLRFGGKLYLVCKPERLTDTLCAMRLNNLEPKALRFVHPFQNKPPSLTLITAQKNAKHGLAISPPLLIYNDSGRYTDEVRAIYND